MARIYSKACEAQHQPCAAADHSSSAVAQKLCKVDTLGHSFSQYAASSHATGRGPCGVYCAALPCDVRDAGAGA